MTGEYVPELDPEDVEKYDAKAKELARILLPGESVSYATLIRAAKVLSE